MNNHRLLTRFLAVALVSGAVQSFAQSQRVITLDSLFRIAETNSVQLKASYASELEANLDIAESLSHRLPNITASLSLSYIGNGFTTNRDSIDCQKAPIPHFGNIFTLSIDQPVYAGGAISNGIKLSEF